MKEKEAIEVIRLAAKMSEQYYGKPLVITYSGGKDSDVLLHLAIKSGANIEVINSHTTVDLPPTVYHIKEVFEGLNKAGIKASVIYPRYEDGTYKSMWSLIKDNRNPPRRNMRYCCRELKETTLPNRFIATGVRAEESSQRKRWNAFEIRSYKNEDRISKSLKETSEVYRDAQVKDEIWDCVFIKKAKENADLICNPIINWTEKDIWDYIKKNKIKYNPLYDMGYSRVGCALCPMGSIREKRKVIKDFPAYKLNYIKTLDATIKIRKERGLKVKFQSGQEWFDWWIENPQIKGQLEWDFETGEIIEHHE